MWMWTRFRSCEIPFSGNRKNLFPWYAPHPHTTYDRMKTHTIMAMVTLALLTGPSSAWATDFNDRTACGALVKATTDRNRMDVRRATDYIVETFGILEGARIAGGIKAF